MKRIIVLLGLVLFLTSSYASARQNLREVFKNNEAIIYTLNIRNFASVDKDHNGIIEVENGDKIGTFVGAKEKLKDLAMQNINTIYLLPITPAGKLKALGTAGSLYAMDEFDKISPELDEQNNDKTVYQEAREFIEEAHRLNMNVILDLPSCGSYDLALRKPDWFILNNKKEPIIPADWTDVRLFKIYNQDRSLNKTTLNNFKSFVDMTLELGFDGIRADEVLKLLFERGYVGQYRKRPDHPKEEFLFQTHINPNAKYEKDDDCCLHRGLIRAFGV